MSRHRCRKTIQLRPVQGRDRPGAMHPGMGKKLWPIEMHETLGFIVFNVPALVIEIGKMPEGFRMAVALLGGAGGAAHDGLNR